MKMELVLQHRGKTCQYSGIALKDFYMPVVNNIESDFQIEPAIWFKSLIIKTIQIDCDLRNVFWERKSQLGGSSSPGGSGSPRVVFEDDRLEECELFNAVIDLIHKRDKKNCSVDDVSREILRILHLHVLPLVLLKDEDLTCLKDALDDVEHRITYMNNLTIDKDKQLMESEKNLREYRENLLRTENFESYSNVKHCTDKFLMELLDDVNREIRILTDRLITFQSCVDMTRNSVANESKLHLKEWRKKRDEVNSSILKLQCIRESIKNVTTRTKKRKKVKILHNEKHDTYVTLKENLRADKSAMQSMFEGKVKITSVREAIIQACNDLKASGESTGYDVPKCGERLSTDILGNSPKPKKWLTLNERIQQILSDKSTESAQTYTTFCASTVKKIRNFLSQKALIDRKRSENVPFFMEMIDFSLPSQQMEKQKATGNPYENVSTELNAESPEKGFTNMIKEEVMQHIYDQCQSLVQLLSKQKSFNKKANCTTINLNNVWVFYELQLYQHLIEPLSDLFENIYKNEAKEMASFVTSTALKDIGVQEQWLLDDEEDREHHIESVCMRNSSNKCFEKNVAIVALRNGRTLTLSELCESDEELNDFFGSPTVGCDSYLSPDLHQKDFKCTKACGQQAFKYVCNELEHMTRSKSIMGKLKSITKANRMVSECASSLKSKGCELSDDNALSADDMLASTTCALTKVDTKVFEKLYAHVHLVNDFIPPFMMGSLQDWSLTNFFCAFQNISCNLESTRSQN